VLIEKCYGYNIGWTNIPQIAWAQPDGSFVAGCWMNAKIVNNYIEKAHYCAIEWDGSVAEYASTYRQYWPNILISGNTIINPFNAAISLFPYHTNKHPTNVRIVDNYIKRTSTFERPVEHYGVIITGGSNVIVKGNQFVNGDANCIDVYVSNTGANVYNVDIDGNSFLNNGCWVGNMIQTNSLVNTVIENVRFRNNTCASASAAGLHCSTPGTIIEGNNFILWPNSTPAIYLANIGTGGYGSASNVVVQHNNFGVLNKINRSCYAVLAYSNTVANWKFLDNQLAANMDSNLVFVHLATSSVYWPLGTNCLFVGDLPYTPTNIWAPGSMVRKTVTSTDGSLFVQTNSAGLPGWRPNL